MEWMNTKSNNKKSIKNWVQNNKLWIKIHWMIYSSKWIMYSLGYNQTHLNQPNNPKPTTKLLWCKPKRIQHTWPHQRVQLARSLSLFLNKTNLSFLYKKLKIWAKTIKSKKKRKWLNKINHPRKNWLWLKNNPKNWLRRGNHGVVMIRQRKSNKNQPMIRIYSYKSLQRKILKIWINRSRTWPNKLKRINKDLRNSQMRILIRRIFNWMRLSLIDLKKTISYSLEPPFKLKQLHKLAHKLVFKQLC